MGSNTCMNELCRGTTSSECKKGWALKSGGFATLCYNCGSAYENLVFCDTFHLEERGWRECRICGKRIHCGCIASKYLHDYMDFGGVGCISCTKRLEAHFTRPVQFSVVNGRVDGSTADNGRLMQLCQTIVASEPGNFCQAQKGEMYASPRKIKQEETLLPIREVNTGFANLIQPAVGPSTFSESHNNRPKQSQTSLSFLLSPPVGNSTSLLPCPNGVVERREQAKASPLQQEQRMHHVLPKPPKSSLVIAPEENKGMSSQARAARPPAEGRGRNQLLQRYWPKITDQELQQLSGDLKSTIVPLFEKVLSASDAGRIGRLVLPKACAEAYFPPISQSDGIPIRIQDVKGKDWAFQFRFWPNNNSRMYVLEGVTPCMQNMQLQAGDTVTFSRIDPGGKLIMGFRKATNTADKQDAQTSFLPNDGLSGETLFPGVNESLPTHGVGSWTDEDPLHQSTLIREKKRTRNIGSKSKRLRMHSDDAMVLRITWKEAQELFRPSPTVKPTIVTIEDHEIEEYEEPPVFGKRTIFTSQSSGEQKQWAQCDSCSKWRRLPIDAFLPPKWTCSDNIWDSNRFLCSAPEEINPKKMNNIFRVGKHFKKPRITENNKVTQELEPSGLDALADAAVLGDNVGDSGESSVGATTKHPRHRPGCSCIVCIQPPSGKGRHKPTCMCNVCLTVKRRFKTLMLRKRKQQTEGGGEIAQQMDRHLPKEGLETDGTAGPESCINILENGTMENGNQMDVAKSSTGHLDLNCHPTHEEEMLEESKRCSMESLVQADTLAVEISFSQNERATLQPCLISQTAGKSEEHPLDEGCLPSADME